ncbi:MAG: Rpn family recombination-promoting nuclease/putative transposase [Clostridia bacterium]|nr:Rpn family recombination-promoting nuclease/putative transposase [Clostridia bacterium]
MERLKPTNDYIFKKIFGSNKNALLLKDLLQSILTDIKISKVVIDKDVSLERQQITNKLGILDVVATLDDNTKVNIEMQVKGHENTIDRSVFYETGLFHESLNSGEDYLEIPKVISIWITDFDVFDEGPFHERARLKRDYENIILTDKVEIHYIQLPKFRKKYKRVSNKLRDKLEDWLTFIENEDLEAIRMIDNKYIQQAEDEFEYLTGDAAERRLAQLREKAIRDEAANLKCARRKGIEEGIEKQKIETAKKMLAKNISINIIMEVTELTKEEIEKLK